MAHPIIFDGTQHREMTDSEFADYVELQNDLAKQHAEQAAAQAAKTAAIASGRAKLSALGLTDAEIAALVD